MVLTRAGLKRTDPISPRDRGANSVLAEVLVRAQSGDSHQAWAELRAGSALYVRRSVGPFYAITRTRRSRAPNWRNSDEELAARERQHS